MYSSSNYNPNYLYSSSSYKAPSRNANSYEVSSNRSRTNLDEIYDETWPLDEVIDKMDIKSDSDDEGNYNRNFQTWNSGPQVIAETYNSGRDVKRTPGEGALYSSFNEGSKTWKNKTVRHHEYNSKKGTQFDLDKKYYKKHHDCDDNNNYLNDELSDSNTMIYYSNLDDDSPTLRDVGIQCNLKKFKTTIPKMNEPIITQKPPIKVIKSSNNGFVSAYSDVPKLTSAPKSIETRHKLVDYDNADWAEPNDAIYSQVNKSCKTRPPSSNINIVYKQPLNGSIASYRSTNDKQYDVKSKEIGFSLNSSNSPKIALPNPNYIESTRNRYYNGSYKDFSVDIPDEREIIEETISISNASTEESFKPSDKFNSHKYGDNLSYTGNSIVSRSSSNYRKESPARSITYDKPNLPRHYGTMEKPRDSKGKIKKKKVYENDENILLANNSLRLKSSKSPYSERLYKSNADLRDQFLRDETRGGLAAAYKNRQQNQTKHRALSLNRMNAIPNEEDVGGQVPSRYTSQTHLNHLSSRLSDSGSSYHRSSRQLQHERDPIVMYIPTVNHQRANTESPKLTSILRNNSTKSNTTLPSKGRKNKEPKSLSKVNLKQEVAKEKSNEKSNSKKKADLNRRHSMPKDTKFNWFSKFKLKSKQ